MFRTVSSAQNFGTENVGVYEKLLQPDTYRVRFYINNWLVKKMTDTGCYIVLVKDTKPNGPNGVFAISKSLKSMSGNIVSLVYSRGESSDFHLEWNPLEYPSVVVQHHKNTTEKMSYSVSIVG